MTSSDGPDPAPARSRVVELSHRVAAGDVTYPGLPVPEIAAHLDHESSRAHYGPGTSFEISRISMVGNTGTYLDAPAHRFASRSDVADLPAGCFADLDGLVVRATDRRSRAIDRDTFLRYDVAGRAVLVHTGWDASFGTAAYGPGEHPYLTADAARHLAGAGAVLVGIDSVNIDDVADLTRPVHTALLDAGIPVVEHLTGLDALPETGFRFHAAPARITGMASFPVRAYAVLER